MTIKNTEQAFLSYIKDMKAYDEALALVQWDLRTKTPPKGAEQRADLIGFLSQKRYAMSTSDEMKSYIEELKNKTNDILIQRSIEECEEEWERNRKIPEQEYRDFVNLQSKSETVWQTAREQNSFSLLQPYLEELVAFNRKFAEYWGYDDHPYDALLHLYEPGVTTALLDDVFPKLRTSLTGLVGKVRKSNIKPAPSLLQHHFPKNKQQEFAENILKRMGYDFDAGRLDETIHPFAITINPNDVRVTTRYDEEDFRMAVFGTIHEGGHALYEQNIADNLAHTPLATGTSMGIHESQSLFWENFVARNEGFWNNHYSMFQSIAPSAFKNLDFADFYRAINEVKPSLIRIEADEMTYALHIMVRYELEKALIGGEMEVKDLPEKWNEKMEEYLGVRPLSDREGVLQDIHWAAGDFGYFPSYALGYMYAAQFHAAMKADFDVEEAIAAGEFIKIKEWLTEHVHQYGKLKKPLEILKDVTREELNPDYLVAYLTDKYAGIYSF